MNTERAALRGETADGEAVTLDLLRVIESESAPTQRGLALRLGIALGLTNAVLRRAAAKGWIKVRSAPARRYAYYLTPQGFAEKSRLTLRYLERSLTAVREAREAYAAEFATCVRRGWARVAVLGSGEMADIALLGAQEAGIHPVALISREHAGRTRSGVPVVADADAGRGLLAASGIEALVLAEVLDPEERARVAACWELSPDRLLAPAFLLPAEVVIGTGASQSRAPADRVGGDDA